MSYVKLCMFIAMTTTTTTSPISASSHWTYKLITRIENFDIYLFNFSVFEQEKKKKNTKN